MKEIVIGGQIPGPRKFKKKCEVCNNYFTPKNIARRFCSECQKKYYSKGDLHEQAKA